MGDTSLRERLSDPYTRQVAVVALATAGLVVDFFGIGNLPFDAAWIAIALCGVPIVLGAAEGLIREFDIKADVLVALALIASVAIGETFAAGEIAVIMMIGAMLEERTVAKARSGIERLVHLTPRTARVLRDGVESVVLAEEVTVGETLRVLAGETVAVDGVIVSGQTSVDQSIMTGESLPVDKGVGDEVFSGTVNQFGAFDMRAERVGGDSSLQRMIRLVESADAGKAKIVRVADRWATWIVVAALTSAAGTYIVTGEVIRAVTILVVFCPCALVLATPTAIMAAIGNATKYGILVREGDALERLAKIEHVAFDKTGTLTFGRPAVVVAESFDEAMPSHELLRLTAAAESRSEHPLGKAIASHVPKGTGEQPLEVSDFELVPARGVRAAVAGRNVLAGNEALLADEGVALPEAVAAAAIRHANEGATVIYVAVDGLARGFIVLSDEVRPEAPAMVAEIDALGVGGILLTGDHPEAAQRVGRQAGVARVHAECRPEDKMAIIERHQQAGEPICMVGDGVNDAPALKIAHVGIAMGGVGSDIAVDAADIALVGDDIGALPHLLGLSRTTMRTIVLNMSLAMGLNGIAVVLAMTGVMTPVMGALVHNAGSVAVILNSARLLNWKQR